MTMEANILRKRPLCEAPQLMDVWSGTERERMFTNNMWDDMRKLTQF